MSNSELIGKKVEITDDIKYHLQKIFNAYKGPKDSEGYSRLRNLCDIKHITYEQLKRIKNFFDTFDGNNKDTVYLLNGGTKMKQWVYEKLDHLRNGVNYRKKNMDSIGVVDINNDKIKISGVKIDNHDTDTNKILRQEGIYRIKVLDELITEINKNKELCLTDNQSHQY